jgi:N6-L-threonylcarbamoyladenine synthase
MLEQMHKTGNLDFSFSGLKTAVLLLLRHSLEQERRQPEQAQGSKLRAEIAAAFQEAIVDVLVAKSFCALDQTGLKQLVVAGGVGANRRLRERLDREAKVRGCSVFYPEFEFCTDNGAMIALAGALRLGAALRENASGGLRVGAGLAHPAVAAYAFSVKPRWDLSSPV